MGVEFQSPVFLRTKGPGRMERDATTERTAARLVSDGLLGYYHVYGGKPLNREQLNRSGNLPPGQGT